LNFNKKLSGKQKILIESAALLLITILVFIFWNSFLVYPIKLLTIIFHEISHAIAGILTGNNVKSIEVQTDLAGKTITYGGKNFFVIFAGYLGSIVWGALIFFAAYKTRYLKIISISIGVIIFLFTANVFVGFVSVVAGLFFGLFFILFPFLKYETLRDYVYKFIGLASMFYVLVDIKEDLLTYSFRITDAFLLYEITGIAPILWGLFYFLFASALLAILIFTSLKNSSK